MVLNSFCDWLFFRTLEKCYFVSISTDIGMIIKIIYELIIELEIHLITFSLLMNILSNLF